MDEKIENPTAKRSRCNEKLQKDDKDLPTSGCSSGQQSPYDDQETNVSSNNNSSASNNNNNSDSGLSSKMEESSFGDTDSMMVTIDSKCDEDENLDVSKTDVGDSNIIQEESMESLPTESKGTVYPEKDCTASHLFKRSKRDRSRNYRTVSASTSLEYDDKDIYMNIDVPASSSTASPQLIDIEQKTNVVPTTVNNESDLNVAQGNLSPVLSVESEESLPVVCFKNTSPIDKRDEDENLGDSKTAVGDTNIIQEESMESLPTAATGSTGTVDLEKDCTASNLIKRSKRNRSRNYRTVDRSTSTSSEDEDKREEIHMIIKVPLSSSASVVVNNTSQEESMESLIYKEESNNNAATASTEVVEESMESLVYKEDRSNDPATTSTEVEKPCTSSNLNKRSKRHRSRNYRTAERSLSTSSSSSTAPASPQLVDGEQTSDVAATTENNDPDVNMAERNLSPVLSLQSSEESLPNPFLDGEDDDNSDDDDDDDDDTDFLPSLFGDRYSSDYASPDSADSARIKEKDEEVNKLLNKQKPSYTWSAAYELMRREHGLSGDGRRSLRNGFTYGFNNRFYASRHVVERMKLSHVLRKHNGCVNCLNFNKGGDLLVTGSDDARLIVWDWAGNKVKHIWKSGHSSNIFQSKFVPTSSFIDIISAARDGRVRRSIVPSSGGKVQTSNLYVHRGPVHKLVICPDNPSEIISVGEDGFICSKDLREEYHKIDLLQVMSHVKKSRKVRLFSISHHPFAPEICVSGSDSYVRVYDKRSMKDPVHTMCPEHILEACTPSVTCCVYNHTGSEILASYSEENIYLFDNKNYVDGEYLHCYKGHYNQKTIKGVNFFGPNCEYVISGSDCGNIFYWDKNTEAILNFMPGDTAGVVNCLEPHPTTPILATSGLDHHIKIWTPSAEKHPPDLTKLTNCVRRNLRRTVIEEAIQFDYNQLQYFIRQTLCRHRRRNRERNNDDEDDSSSPSSMVELETDNDDSDDDEDVSNLQRLNCGTQ
ncbi:uncharacterized protein [Musca autumnalis]|uniref:uncharacterized protein n=1 Tax=Musca autumnalis TaxID=221902 RepID=UPI003CFA0F19